MSLRSRWLLARLITSSLCPQNVELQGPCSRTSGLLPLCRVSTNTARGRLSAELLCPYPPGVPLAFPGEPLTEAVLQQLQQVVHHGGCVTGASDQTLQTILVLQVADLTT